ncbi:MAG: hypothetical protein HQ490_05385 [Lutibacter sp.]|nr:hypothetical protein [Lutibacter sp.]
MAPVSSVICEICKDNEVIFIDECTVLPISKKDIDYKVDGLDRSGWLFQQFLKWSGESFTEMSDYLVLDSDTVFIRDQVFEYSNKIVMDCADEYHKPYFEFIKRTFGFEVKFPLSFTSHHILIRKSYIHEMKLFLENKYKCAWYFAIISQIDRSLPSAVSDYDNYGQFIYKYHRSEVCLEYWGNESFSRRDIERLGELKKMFSKVRKSLSFHSYSK